MRINKKIKNFWLPFLLAAAFCLGWPLLANAIVAGPCANCHTMHNSQDGAAEVHLAADGGHWSSGTGVWAGSTNPTPQKNLLKSDCVGCHSSSSSETVVTLGGVTKIPIVYNTGGPAAGTELAGGNFFYTVGDSNMGHNVAGIAGRDPLPFAPGLTGGTCNNSCHESLVDPIDPASDVGIPIGCEGCHTMVGHHDVGVNGGTGPGNSYRFLAGHGGAGLSKFVENGITSVGVEFEGVNWGKQDGDENLDRNLYMVQNSAYVSTDPFLPIGRWCAGCHGQFHAFGDLDEMLMPVNINGGDRDMNPTTNPWLRHPTNVFIPNAGEYTGLGGVLSGSVIYNPETGIPLARSDYVNGRTANVAWGDQVMCLSCHKAHGSQWPDALRFDKDTMNAHTGAGTRTDGCFFCHRLKDDP